MISKWLVFVITLLVLPSLQAAETNDCHDPQTNQQWQAMLAKRPDDSVIIKLFALRAGLCVMIDQGLITVDQGTRLFEQERKRAIIERQTEEQQRSPEYET